MGKGDTVKLISAEGAEFIVDVKAASISNTIKVGEPIFKNDFLLYSCLMLFYFVCYKEAFILKFVNFDLHVLFIDRVFYTAMALCFQSPTAARFDFQKLVPQFWKRFVNTSIISYKIPMQI